MAASSAAEGAVHLAELSDEMRSASREVGAGAALDRLFEVADLLTSAGEHEPSAVELQQTCATPLAWAAARTEQVARADGALQVHADAQRDERSAAQDLRRLEQDETEARHRAEDSTLVRQAAEERLVEEVAAWEARVTHFDDVPADLVESRDSVGERLAPDRVEAWLSSTASLVRSRIDVAGRHRAADTAAALRDQAEQSLGVAREEQRRAEEAVGETTAALLAVHEENQAEEAEDGRRRDS
ncbi:hypothetical protein J7S33_28320, partial [Saccharothrix algeriensis]